MPVPPAPLFQLLAEPRRLEIVELLRDGERPVGELVDALGISQPAVSKHLRLLKTAGVVDVRPDGQRRYYHLKAEPFSDLDAWLDPYRELWSTHLDRLEAHLDARRTT
ncbi:MAG TPA: metalloregulator ArsR/SmtB family transcription factor [Acidimicrobiia bacterium]|jgi:DNA-binding transcriptional ArsR family regulator|nr:metalloregulator ArsR/SmtB family transcription factor [Acidimicrobiia bacterium]